MGGVKIKVAQKMRYFDPYNRYTIKLDPGSQLLDGNEAMQYVRFRNDPQDEASRLNRQQQLLLALFKKVNNPGNLLKIPTFMEIRHDYLRTDLTNQELTQLWGFLHRKELKREMTGFILPGKYKDLSWETDPAQVYQLMTRLRPRKNVK